MGGIVGRPRATAKHG